MATKRVAQNSGPIDTTQPWSIKSVAGRTKALAAAAARRENLTVGQWLEKRIDEWHVSDTGGPTVADLATLLTAAGAMAQNVVLAPEVLRLIDDTARLVRRAPERRAASSQRARQLPDGVDHNPSELVDGQYSGVAQPGP